MSVAFSNKSICSVIPSQMQKTSEPKKCLINLKFFYCCNTRRPYNFAVKQSDVLKYVLLDPSLMVPPICVFETCIKHYLQKSNYSLTTNFTLPLHRVVLKYQVAFSLKLQSYFLGDNAYSFFPTIFPS